MVTETLIHVYSAPLVLNNMFDTLKLYNLFAFQCRQTEAIQECKEMLFSEKHKTKKKIPEDGFGVRMLFVLDSEK